MSQRLQDLSIHLVVMAGGSGTRFWPKSTRLKPKQFLAFGAQSKTLLQTTLDRFDGLVEKSKSHRMIVTTEILAPAMRDLVPSNECDILAEPSARNTAPCVYWAARAIYDRDPNAILLVMPSDHHIPQLEKFQNTVREAIHWAASHDDLVTLGVKPDRPETGYGYLKSGSSLGSGCQKVEAFVEKPNLERAKEFLASGQYFWNGGMFVWKAKTILDAFDRLMPEMKTAWDSARGQVDQCYPKMTATSIDFGVMEKSSNVVMFPLDCGWDDLGSWTSLEGLADSLGARHEAGVVTSGQVIAIDSGQNIVDVPGQFLTLLGVKDLIIVRQGDTMLIADKSRAQDIRLVVEAVKKNAPERL